VEFLWDDCERFTEVLPDCVGIHVFWPRVAVAQLIFRQVIARANSQLPVLHSRLSSIAPATGDGEGGSTPCRVVVKRRRINLH